MKRSILSSVLFLTIYFSYGQIPNADMEYWDNAPLLLQWETNSRPMTLPPWEPYIVKQDTERYSGNFAANLYANGMFKAYGIATFPVSYHPQNLSLYYKLSFAPCVNDNGFPDKDTASVLVEMLNSGAVVDQGYWESTTTSFNYSQLVIPISQNATVFDSCRITMMGGKVIGGCGIIAASTEFKVDHLELKYSSQAGCIDSLQICDTCACIALYAPVCGCDEKTYGNSCEAYNAGVISWSQGACGSSGWCIDSAQVCDTCPCPLLYDPVCGCDGVTYGNSCEAFYAGVLSWTPGDCWPQPTCIDSSKICDTCTCPFIYDPVCGCDGITYGNDCVAQNAGVISWFPGPCFVTDSCNADFYYWLDGTGYTAQFQHAIGWVTSGGTGTTQSFVWDFGDGSSSTDEFPSHTYTDTSIHSYWVCLTVTDSLLGCSDTHCDSVYVGAFVPGCYAGFGYTIDSNGVVVVYPDSSSGVSAGGWIWVWGTDTSTINPNPTFQIDSNSNYDVCFIVMNDSMQCTDTVCITSTELYSAYLAMGYSSLSSDVTRVYLYPNPASENAEIRFTTAHSGRVDITVRNILGETVYQFPATQLNSGSYSYAINTGALSSGVYLVEMKINGSVAAVRKLIRQ